MAFEEMRSSSGIWRSADHDSALKPSAIDSPRPMIPRMIGTLAQRSAQVGASWVTISISPSGVRTATAQRARAAHHDALP